MRQNRQPSDATDITETDATLARLPRRGLIVGVIGLIVAVVGVLVDIDQAFQSYLFSYIYWLGITLGCLVWLFIHDMTGGRWGDVMRPVLESGALLIGLMALLFIPLLFGLDRLYIWAQPEIVAQDPLLQHKAPYLNVPFFTGRAVLYFVLWGGMVFLLHRWWRMQAREPSARVAAKLRRYSGYALALYGITVTFGSVDWLMSLDPHWYSTVFGILVAAGQAITALAFTIWVLVLLRPISPFATAVTADHLSDLGNLLLTSVIFWAYIAFMQYLIIWSGNLPEDVLWYLHRLEGGWRWLPTGLIVFHFAVPFALLLSGAVKRNPRWLVAVALLLLFANLVHLFWIVAPTYAGTLRVHWLDVAMPLFLGGLWIAAFVWALRRKITAYALPVQE